MSSLQKIAILVEQLYEDQELWYPYYRLKEAGYDVNIVGPEKKPIIVSINILYLLIYL